MRVLVADSHVTVRKALRRLLDEEPDLVLVGEVTCARELLAQARAMQADVVLMEWELPGTPGGEDRSGRGEALQAMRRLMYQLHALPAHPQLVALSGWPETQKLATLAGVDAYVSKGSPPWQLLTTLRGIAKERKSRHSRRRSQSPTDPVRQEPEVTMKIKNYRKVKAEATEPGITIRWLISELDDAPNFAMKLYELAPATISPVHTHAWEDEVFVLRGQGAVVGPDGEIAIGEGDVIYIPPMERHQFVNAGERELCLLMSVPISEQVSLGSGVGE
jgi:quercetin dioxygenase-like cupin family protein/CheY-like chemotaxis protein